MLFRNNPDGIRTHYEILGVGEDATQEELRRKYRSAILANHPDKLQNSSEPFLSSTQNRFLEVQKAWEVLGNASSRAVYDSELRNLRLNDSWDDDINLEDMDIRNVDNGFELSYSCRCGDSVLVDSSELSDMGYPFSRNGEEIWLPSASFLPVSIVLPCGSCSHKIRLRFDADVIKLRSTTEL